MEEKEKKEELEDLEDDDLDLDDLDEDEEEEEESGEDENPAEDEETKKSKEQTKAERARQAQLRREREAKEREAREKAIREKAYNEGRLNASKVNTFTNQPIEDEYDLKVFDLQKEIEKEGGDPIADLPKKLAELDRKQAKEAKESETAKQEQDEIITNDIKAFRAKYPDVNLKELLADPDFKDYSDGRLGIKGGQSLATIYENFNKFKAKYGGGKKEEEDDDNDTTPPSPNGGRKNTKTSYSKMTEEQKIAELRRQGLIN